MVSFSVSVVALGNMSPGERHGPSRSMMLEMLTSPILTGFMPAS
jgi:hypothetical protein